MSTNKQIIKIKKKKCKTISKLFLLLTVMITRMYMKATRKIKKIKSTILLIMMMRRNFMQWKTQEVSNSSIYPEKV